LSYIGNHEVCTVYVLRCLQSDSRNLRPSSRYLQETQVVFMHVVSFRRNLTIIHRRQNGRRPTCTAPLSPCFMRLMTGRFCSDYRGMKRLLKEIKQAEISQVDANTIRASSEDLYVNIDVEFALEKPTILSSERNSGGTGFANAYTSTASQPSLLNRTADTHRQKLASQISNAAKGNCRNSSY
jgi:hypothetical protein